MQIVLSVTTPTGNADDELHLKAAIGLTLGDGWRVERLFPLSLDEPGLLRFFRVVGELAVPDGLLAGVAFELSYRLQAATGFEVQPDLPFDPMNLTDAVQEHEFLGGAPAEPALPEAGPKDWALQALRLPQAWALTPPQTGRAQGEGVSIGVPDTGYTDHPEVGLEHFDLVRDADFLEGDDDALDPLRKELLTNPGHGTSVAACLAARKRKDIQGAAPRAIVVPLRSVVRVVGFHATDVARAVEHARRQGVDVISMSLGSRLLSPLRAAVERALAQGIIVVAAGGQIVKVVPEPANYPGVIGVGASNARSLPWSRGTPGPHLAWCAPGESVWTPSYGFERGQPRPEVIQSHGTSFSTAFTAGIAALWLAFHGRQALQQRYGARTAAAFRHVGRRSCLRTPDWDPGRYGAGILQADQVLQAALPDEEELETWAAAEAAPSFPFQAELAHLDLIAQSLHLPRAQLLAAASPSLRKHLQEGA